MSCCANGTCTEPQCQLCRTSARFPGTAEAMRLQTKTDKKWDRMSDEERLIWNSKRQFKLATDKDKRDGTPKLAGERAHAGTASKNRAGSNWVPRHRRTLG